MVLRLRLDGGVGRRQLEEAGPRRRRHLDLDRDATDRLSAGVLGDVHPPVGPQAAGDVHRGRSGLSLGGLERPHELTVELPGVHIEVPVKVPLRCPPSAASSDIRAVREPSASRPSVNTPVAVP